VRRRCGRRQGRRAGPVQPAARCRHADAGLPPGAAGDQPVILQALIDTDGTMEQITYVGGPGDLVAAATEAVRRWRSEPGRINGAPIPMGGAMLQVRFTAGTPKVER
jgi:hypothetical protein